MPTPSAFRRMASDDGWVLFLYGRRDVLGIVFDVEQPRGPHD